MSLFLELCFYSIFVLSFAECRFLNVIMLNVILLNVILLNVVAPVKKCRSFTASGGSLVARALDLNIENMRFSRVFGVGKN
jgi:hypothetical protein